jgi:hypothetical protein
MRATAGEVISARAEADQNGTLRPASRGDETGIVTRSGRLRPLLPRHPTAIFRHDGATNAAPRRGAHRRRRVFPGRTRLLVAAVGGAIAAAGMSAVALMSDQGAPAPPVTGQARAETHRLDVPMARPLAPPDEAEQQMMHPDEVTALHRLAAAAPLGRHPAAMPTEQAGPARSPNPPPAHPPTREPEPAEDAEPAQDADGTPPGKSEESPGKSQKAESRDNEDRDRGSDGRPGGADRRGD